MANGIGRPLLKMRKAAEHIEDLRAAIDSYRVSGGFNVEQTIKDDGWLYLTLRVETAPPFDDWALVFGDCVHNVRSALDHLAWQLDPKPDRDTMFPIFTAPPKSWPTTAVARMDPQAQGIIEQLQPYNVKPGEGPPERHPLATLHALDIADKHQALTMTNGAVGGDSITGLQFGSSVESSGWQPWEDGVDLARVRLPPGSGGSTQVGYRPYFNVVLVDDPWASADVMYIVEEVLLGWIRPHVIDPLLPLTRP